MFETKRDIEQEDHVQQICESLEDLSCDLRGFRFTEKQWQTIRQCWVEFGMTLAPSRPPKGYDPTARTEEFVILSDSLEFEIVEDNDYDRAMDMFK